jgi:hypothetical protein
MRHLVLQRLWGICGRLLAICRAALALASVGKPSEGRFGAHSN